MLCLKKIHLGNSKKDVRSTNVLTSYLWLWSLDLVAHDTFMIQFTFILCILHHFCLDFAAPLPPAVALLVITGYLGLYAFWSCFEPPCVPSHWFLSWWFLRSEKIYCSQHVNSRAGFKKKRRFWSNEQMWDYEDVKNQAHLAHTHQRIYEQLESSWVNEELATFEGCILSRREKVKEWKLHLGLKSASHFWTMLLELYLWMYHFAPIFFIVSLLSLQNAINFIELILIIFLFSI